MSDTPIFPDADDPMGLGPDDGFTPDDFFEAPAPPSFSMMDADDLEAPSNEPDASDGPTLDAPVFEATAYEMPGDDVPAFEAPSFEAPSFEAPSAEAPSYEASEYEMPAYEAPVFDGPSFDAPAFEAASPDGPVFGSVPLGADGPQGGATVVEAGAFGTDVMFDQDEEELELFAGIGHVTPAPAPTAGAPEEVMLTSAKASEPTTSRPGGTKGGGRLKSKDALVLGIHVTSQKVFGVLVRLTSDGYEPLRQFVRNRVEGQHDGDTGAMTPDQIGIPTDAELNSTDGVDIQFGGAGELDFSAEFSGLSDIPEVGFGDTAPDLQERIQPVVFEVKDILEECVQAGFPRPAIGFAVGAPDVDYQEVVVPPEKRAKTTKKAATGKKGAAEPAAPEVGIGGDKHDKLVALLHKETPGADKDRIGFLPMTPRDGRRRYLAVLPAATEPVVPSVEMFREQSRHRKTAFRTLQAEVPLLVGMASLVAPSDEGQNTAVVRVGTEDTLVLLLTGGVLHHMELMQSVTAFDGPDTICSRVLLQQDVQGVGMVHDVVVLAEEREDDLVQGFAAFYPDARVETLREGLARLGMVGPYGPLAPTLVEAAGAALAAGTRKGPFGSVNLLPAALRKGRRPVDLSFAWHTVVVAALLFLSVLFFAYLYVSQKNDIADAEQRLAEFPPEAQMSAPQLQARIDSLRARQADLTQNMIVLDSLLFGTDRWTQTLLVTTRAAAATGGVWIETWEPSGSEVAINGFATARSRVVSLAERLGATIETVTFKEVREYPVYEYRLRYEAPFQLPQTARVVREMNGEPLPLPPPEPLAGFDAPLAAPAPAPAPDPAAAPPPDAAPVP